MAAEILGELKVKEAVKALRQAVKSKDYYLAGKSMVALAKLGDGESIPDIRKIFMATRNPRLIIHGAKALEYFADAYSLPALVGKLEEKPFPFIRDEIILAIAGIVGLSRWFYPYYAAFLEKAGTGILSLKDEVNAEKVPVPFPFKEKLNSLLDLLVNQETAFVKQVLIILKDMKEANMKPDEKYMVIFEGLKNSRISPLVRFRFLTAAVLVRLLKPPAL